MKGCRALTNEELELMYLKANPHYRALICFGVRTGFRIAEIISLQWKQLSNEMGEIGLSVEVCKRNVKGSTESRRVPLHQECAVYLKQYYESLHPLERRPSDSVFPRHHTVYRKGLKKLVKKAGIDESGGRVSTHSLRKTFCRKMYLQLDKDIFKLQKAMSHKSISSTSLYLSVDSAEIEEAIRRVK